MKVRIEFKKTVKYSKEIELTDAEYDIVKDLDNDDVHMYVKKDGKLISNPQYDIIESIASFQNIEDVYDELNDVTVEEL